MCPAPHLAWALEPEKNSFSSPTFQLMDVLIAKTTLLPTQSPKALTIPLSDKFSALPYHARTGPHPEDNEF